MKKIIVLCLLLSGCAAYNARQLYGLSESDITGRFGTPILKRTESPYQLWTYHTNDCSTLIFFDEHKIVQHVDFIGSCP